MLRSNCKTLENHVVSPEFAEKEGFKSEMKE